MAKKKDPLKITDKHKNNYLWIGITVIAVIVLAIVFMNNSVNKKVLQSDISISSFKYEEVSGGKGMPIRFNKNNQLETDFSLKISTSRDDLYYRVYDVKHDLEINKDYSSTYIYEGAYPRKLELGDNRFEGFSNLVLDSLSDSPQIKVCISTDSKFTKDFKNVICKIETFSAPEFRLEVTPNPMTFTISKKEGAYDTPHQILSIKNTGNIVTPSLVFLPSYSSLESYQKSYPQYLTSHIMEKSWLQPGETYEYDIGVMTGNIGEFDTPIGTYETKGYVWGLGPKDGQYSNWLAGQSSFKDALFKQEFTLKTIVNP